ncbi:unnamed protein product [Miscanthus lutarioriparius]|uniref:Uncharacterized protein n=1 Tax=Miscanthus lutarioriparius TaxID=422564 RepID=A0A811R6D7_9POAL|nr:unnamed protein product [Miscanthus lutarioriparius]
MGMIETAGILGTRAELMKDDELPESTRICTGISAMEPTKRTVRTAGGTRNNCFKNCQTDLLSDFSGVGLLWLFLVRTETPESLNSVKDLRSTLMILAPFGIAFVTQTQCPAIGFDRCQLGISGRSRCCRRLLSTGQSRRRRWQRAATNCLEDDQSPALDERASGAGFASSCNIARVQAVSKLGGHNTSTIALISGRRPSINLIVKYMGFVLEE